MLAIVFYPRDPRPIVCVAIFFYLLIFFFSCLRTGRHDMLLRIRPTSISAGQTISAAISQTHRRRLPAMCYRIDHVVPIVIPIFVREGRSHAEPEYTEKIIDKKETAEIWNLGVDSDVNRLSGICVFRRQRHRDPQKYA